MANHPRRDVGNVYDLAHSVPSLGCRLSWVVHGWCGVPVKVKVHRNQIRLRNSSRHLGIVLENVLVSALGRALGMMRAAVSAANSDRTDIVPVVCRQLEARLAHLPCPSPRHENLDYRMNHY